MDREESAIPFCVNGPDCNQLQVSTKDSLPLTSGRFLGTHRQRSEKLHLSTLCFQQTLLISETSRDEIEIPDTEGAIDVSRLRNEIVRPQILSSASISVSPARSSLTDVFIHRHPIFNQKLTESLSGHEEHISGCTRERSK